MPARAACARWTVLIAASIQVAGCLRAQSRAEPRTTPHRYIFVAGTLGTGLEFWSSVMRECINQKVCDVRSSSFYTTTMFESSNGLETQKEWGRYRPTSTKIIPVNLVSPKTDRMPDSYFIHQYSGKAVWGNEDPQLDLYQQVAKHWGDSFKVLVMTRKNDNDLLAHYMRMRKKMKLEEAEALAVNNTKTLIQQLRNMPNSTYRCQRFDDLLGLGEHLGPFMSMNNEDANSFIHFTYQGATKSSLGCEPRKKCPGSVKLRAMMDELESLCDPRDLGTKSELSKAMTMAQMRVQDEFYEQKVKWFMSF